MRLHPIPRKAWRLVPVASIAIFSASCASSTPPVLVKPRLPAPPPGFARVAPLPPAAIGKSLSVFALENRAAARLANRRLENDRAFYAGVRREFGAKE